MRCKSNIFSLGTRLCAIFLASSVLSGWAFTQAVTLAPKVGPPTAHISVGGSGFPANSAVDVYFDLTDLALVATDSTGSFSKLSIQAPKSALPGTHWVTAIARSNQAAAQTAFKVRTDWSQFGFTPGNTRQNPYENVLDVNSVTGLDLSWSYFNDYFPILSTPAVSGGTLYFGSYDSNLYALNATTGKKLWSSATGSLVTSSPAVSQGNVYFGSYDGNVYALNAKTGAFVWAYATGAVVETSPTVSNGTVYIVTSDSTLTALNAATGALLWSYFVDGITLAPPSVANGAVYVVGLEGTYSINATTGTLNWFVNTLEMQGGTAVAQGVLYVAMGNVTTLGLSTVTGNARDIGNFGSNSFALGGSALYVGTSTGVYATNPSGDFSTLWNFADYQQPVVAAPAVANGVVYANDYAGIVHAIHASYGYELWSFQTGNLISTSPVVANGMLYVASRDGNLYAFGLPSGPAKIQRPDPGALVPDMSLQTSK